MFVKIKPHLDVLVMCLESVGERWKDRGEGGRGGERERKKRKENEREADRQTDWDRESEKESKRERESERKRDREIDWLTELYFSMVKILTQRPTRISAIAYSTTNNQETETKRKRKRENKLPVWGSQSLHAWWASSHTLRHWPQSPAVPWSWSCCWGTC